MDARSTIRSARLSAGLTLRELGERAGTSHSTLAAYEAGRKVPTVDTFVRVVDAAGFRVAVELQATGPDLAGRGEELEAVLDLAAQFPARHDRQLRYPPFLRSGGGTGGRR